MKKSEYINLIEDALGEEPGTLSGTEPLEEIDWDSMVFLNFVAQVDSKLGVTLSPDEVLKCTTVNDLVDLVDAKFDG